MSAVINSTGQFFVCPHAICFYATVFGSSTKKLFSYDEIRGVTTKGKKEIIFETNKKIFAFQFDEKVEEIANFIEKLRAATTVHIKNPHEKHASEVNDSSASNLVKSADKQNIDEKFALSKKDWKIIMNGANLMRFKKDELIRKKGDSQNRIMQLAKGNARVMISEELTVGNLRQGEIFGEISYLQNGPVTANVLADEDDTLVYVIEGKYLDLLYIVAPDLAARFFFYMSVLLANRIEHREIK